MSKINVARYSEDKECVEPEGLKKKFLKDLLPTVNKLHLQRNRCLVATYIKPAVTKKGIIIPQNTQEEDRWQGKVGLLLRVGPSAFDFEEVREAVERHLDALTAKRAAEGKEFTRRDETQATRAALKEMGVPKVGDWVAYRTSETHEIGIPVAGEHVMASCRLITDDCIAMRIADPRMIY